MIPITIHDHITNDCGTIIINDYELETMCAVWEHNDPLIERLKKHDEFRGCGGWCDLNLRHFQILVALHITAGISEPLVEKGLRVVLTALCVRLQEQIEGDINLITIQRTDPNEVHIDFSASIAVHRLTPRRPRFTVVVNNN